MSLPNELLAVMQDATFNPYTGVDQWGNNTYGADCTLKVRLEGPTHSMMTRVADGGTVSTVEERSVKLIADYVSPAGISPKGKITVNGLEYRVTEVVTHHDEKGPYYQDLTCSINIER
jgi:hypothetical protein